MSCRNLGVLVERLSTCCERSNKYQCDRFNKTVIPKKDCSVKCSGFNIDEDVMDKYQIELEQQTRYPFPGSTYGKGGGYGVIYVGGGKYWTMIVVGIKMLRATGCTLPVQVWYRGSCEAVIPSEVEGMGVTLIDSDEVSKKHKDNRIPTGNAGSGGWEAKLYAIYHSSFDKVVFLDADAYCVENPEKLLGLLRFTPFLYWKDFDNQRRSIKWEIVYPPGKTMQLFPVQGGQFILDKIKLWKQVHIANWICQNSPHYFNFMFGDQDTWRVAFAATKFVVPPIDKAHWKEGIAFVCGYKGTDYVVHRCQGKMLLPEDIPTGRVKCSNPQYALPSECKAYDYFAEVINSRPRDSKKVFHDIYAKRIWGVGSGAGTQLKESQLYIDYINHLIRKNGWKKVVDLGSGDGLVSSKLEAETYIGYDCVEYQVQICNSRYGGVREIGNKVVNRCYKTLDILTESGIIDSGDVLLCKDVLHHLPNKEVSELLTGLIKSNKWKEIVCTQDSDQIHDGQDTYIGGYRALSPDMFPLNQFEYSSRIRVHHKLLLVINNERNAHPSTDSTAE